MDQAAFEAMVLREGPEAETIRQAIIETIFASSPESAQTKEGRQSLEVNTFKRYNRFVTGALPWIQRVFDLRGSRVLEIGAGTGASAVALARIAGEVLGVDPKERTLVVARKRAEALGVTNVQFVTGASPEIFDRLDGLLPPPLDAIVCPAVLEHQTITERIQTIKRSWAALRPGGVLVMTNTPNRLTYRDTHTTGLPFHDMLEPDLALRTYARSSRAFYVKDMKNSRENSYKAAIEMHVRRGRGVSYYEFDLALHGRPYRILADGYEPEITRDFPVAYDERLLQSFIARTRLDVPSVFQRHTMFGIFQKLESDESPEGSLDRTFSPFVATREDVDEIAKLIREGSADDALESVEALLGREPAKP